MIGPRKLTDPTQRVVVPVTIRGGQIVPFYGGEMPKLREGAVMDLITEEAAFLDRSELERFNKDDIREILPTGTEMYAVIARDDQKFHKVAEKIAAFPPPGGATVLIPFKLAGPLRLHLRGTRKAELMSCLCDLGIEGDEFPTSVNQAYSRLSEKYETWRRSHTGNVFTKVYFRVPGINAARPLEDLRIACEAEAEKSLFHQSGVLPLDGGSRPANQ
jgi:hypothetical protein